MINPKGAARRKKAGPMYYENGKTDTYQIRDSDMGREDSGDPLGDAIPGTMGNTYGPEDDADDSDPYALGGEAGTPSSDRSHAPAALGKPDQYAGLRSKEDNPEPKRSLSKLRKRGPARKN